jgi:dTDP-4-dehydrorhamnose 3,5-epimerase
MIEVVPLSIPDVLRITPRVFTDDRGYFYESFNEALFRINTRLNLTFVQDNESFSKSGVIRGLHFQIPPKSQAKLIRVVEGKITDVVVDLRKSSPTFGQWLSIELSAENKDQLFVPEGFAHGFFVHEDNTVVNYKCTQYYSPESERCLAYNDPSVDVQWPNHIQAILSPKDEQGLSLEMCSSFFI